MTGDVSSAEKSTIGRFNPLHAALHVLVRPVFRAFSRVAPGTASRLALRLFLTPPRHRVPMREIWWSTEAETFEVPFGAGRLAAWRWGLRGPTVLLVHGWAGRGRQLGAFAEPLVETGFRVVAFDAPGHGEATGRRSSLPEFAAAVDAVVRHLGGVAAIVAHSLGAAATTVALGRPAGLDVERLVFLAPPYDLTAATERFGELLGFSPEVTAGLRAGLEARFGFRWDELQGAALAPRMDRPLLVVHDSEDREVPWSEGRALAEAWPGARLESTRGLGHRRILRDDTAIAAAVGFVKEHEAERAAA